MDSATKQVIAMMQINKEIRLRGLIRRSRGAPGFSAVRRAYQAGGQALPGESQAAGYRLFGEHDFPPKRRFTIFGAEVRLVLGYTAPRRPAKDGRVV